MTDEIVLIEHFHIFLKSRITSMQRDFVRGKLVRTDIEQIFNFVSSFVLSARIRVIYFDLLNVFDSDDHPLLIHKLQSDAKSTQFCIVSRLLVQGSDFGQGVSVLGC